MNSRKQPISSDRDKLLLYPEQKISEIENKIPYFNTVFPLHNKMLYNISGIS